MKKDRRIVFGSFILILAILFVAAVELSLRFIGLTPWQLTKPVFDVTPGEFNLPHDNHASAIANKKYADKLEKFLRDRQVLKLSAELPE